MTKVSLPNQLKKENIKNNFSDPEILEPIVEYKFEHLTTLPRKADPKIAVEVQNYTSFANNELKTETEVVENTVQQKEFNESVKEVPQLLPENDFSDFESNHIKTVGVEIYPDALANNPVNSIDWGVLIPGGNKSIECYLKNIGEADLILSLETTNWIPSEVSNYLTLTWNYDGQTLEVDETIQVKLILIVSEEIYGITGFFFDISIIGSAL
jgi:hypothetical protein